MNEHTSGPWEVRKLDKGFGIGSNDPGLLATVSRRDNARLIAEAPELYAELDMIVDAWEEIDVGKVPGRQLTPWEKERLNFARDLLDRIDGK